MFRCPQCQATQHFLVSAIAIVAVDVFQFPDGSDQHEVDDPQDVTWDAHSSIECQRCLYTGTVDAFTVDDLS